MHGHFGKLFSRKVKAMPPTFTIPSSFHSPIRQRSTWLSVVKKNEAKNRDKEFKFIIVCYVLKSIYMWYVVSLLAFQAPNLRTAIISLIWMYVNDDVDSSCNVAYADLDFFRFFSLLRRIHKNRSHYLLPFLCLIRFWMNEQCTQCTSTMYIIESRTEVNER